MIRGSCLCGALRYEITGALEVMRSGLKEPAAYVDGLGELAALGVTWTGAPVIRGNPDATLEAIATFGEEIVPKLR